MADEEITGTFTTSPVEEAEDQQQEAAPPQSTDEMLRQLLAEREQDRASLREMREEIQRQRIAPRPTQSSVARSAEELQADRMEEIEQHDFYCPGCGALYDYRRPCNGTGEAPHPPIEVVSTDELKGDDPSKHTPAPGVSP